MDEDDVDFYFERHEDDPQVKFEEVLLWSVL